VCEGRRPPPPPEIDLYNVDRWMRSSSWWAVGVQETLRISQEEKITAKGRSLGLCRKTQVVIQATPIKVFLAYMMTDTNDVFRRVTQHVRSVQQIDDHTDVIHLVLQPVSYAWGFNIRPRDFCVMRYWRLDDDGSYVICLNSVTHSDCPVQPGVVRGNMQSVFVIAPRKDYADYDEDVTEALVTHIVDVDPRGWVSRFPYIRGFFSDLLLLHILDVKDLLDLGRFRQRGEPVRPGDGARGADKKGALHTHSASGGGAKGPGEPAHRSSVGTSIKQRFKKRRFYGFHHKSVPGSPEEHQRVSGASLRSRISAKEYEVHRLEMEIGRNGAERSREKSYDLLRQLQDQLEEVEKLKKEYKSLTGKDWQQHGGGSNAAAPAPSPTATPQSRPSGGGGIASPNATSAGQDEGRPHSRGKHTHSQSAPVAMLDDRFAHLGDIGRRRPVQEMASATDIDQLDFDDDGVPVHWLSTAKPALPDASEIIGQLCCLLLFCGLFFTTLFLRRLLPWVA
jgi:hypothetical protein